MNDLGRQNIFETDKFFQILDLDSSDAYIMIISPIFDFDQSVSDIKLDRRFYFQ